MQDPIKRRKLYEYLKSNELTDLSFDEFSNEYATNTNKTQKLYSYLKSNELTDLDSDTFYKEYFGDVKKKDVGGASVSKSQEEVSVSVGETAADNTATQQPEISEQQYNPNLPDDFQTLEPNPDFNENQPESVFNPKYIDNKNKQPQYTSVLDKASDEDLKLLNDFEQISAMPEPETADQNVDNILNTMYADNLQKQVDDVLENSYDFEIKENIAPELEKQAISIEHKQKEFIENLPKEKQERLKTLVKAKKFEQDVNLKFLKTEIQDLDKQLSQSLEHVNTYKEQFDLLEQEKQRLQEQAKEVDDIKPLTAQYNALIEKQKQLLKEQEQINNEVIKLYKTREHKAYEVENYKNNIGTFEQEIDLLKRNWGTLDNIGHRLMLGTREIVDAFDYASQRDNIRAERERIKKLIKESDLTDTEIRKQIPPQYLIGEFNEKEYDQETQKLQDNVLRELQTRKEQYQNVRDRLAPEITHIQDKQDFVDYTLYNLSNAAGMLTQFAIPVVGEASGVLSTKLNNEIEYRTENLEIKDKIKDIEKQLQTADNKQELERKKQELENELLSETQLQTASSLAGISFVALSRLGGFTKQLAKGRRILNDVTESELQPYLKQSLKKTAQTLAQKGIKGAKEVLKETAEGTATMGAGLTLTNNAIQHFVAGKKDVGLLDGMNESVMSMANLSSVLAIAPRLTGMTVSYMSSNNRRAKVYTNVKRIAEYKKTLATEKLSEDTQNRILEKIKQLNEENKRIVKSSIRGFDNLEKDDRAMLLNLSDRAKQLEISLAEINRRKKPTDVELELKAELEKELLDIDKEKDYIIEKEITVKKDGVTKYLNKKQFEEFLQDDDNVRLINQGKADVNIRNYKELPKLLEQRIKDVSAPKEAVEFAKALDKKAEVNPETESVVVEGKTEITAKDNQVEIKGEIDVEKAIDIADEQGVELKVEKPKDETKKKTLEEKGFVEQEDSMVRKPDTETIEIPKGDISKGITIETDKDTYIVKVDNGKILIEPKFAEKVTEGERKKVIDKFVKETNFDNGKQVDFDGVNPADANRLVAEQSENPYEVALALKQERENKVDKTDEGNITRKRAIAIELQSGIDYQDYRKHGAKGKGNATSKAWFKKNPDYRHHSIESVLERLQANYPHLDKQKPFDVTDITDFIESVSRDEYQNILKEKYKTETEIELEHKFEQLTGLKADEKTIDNVLKLDEKTEVETDFTIDDDGEIPFQTQSKYGHIAGKVLKGLVDKLKLTNLAKGVKILSESDTLKFFERLGAKDAYLQSDAKALSEKGIIETPNGFVYKDVVYLVREKVKADTPIHEYGHLWNKYAKEHLPDVYKKGAELIKDTKYYKDLENNPAYKDLSDERKIDEALAQYIGEKGARIVDESKKQKLARWFRTLFRKIGQQLGFTGRQKEINKVKKQIQDPQTTETQKQFLRKRLEIMEKSKNKFIENLTIEEFANYVAGELLAGEPIIEKKTERANYVNEVDISQIDVEYKRNKAIKETREKVSEQLRNKKTYAEKIKKSLHEYINEVLKSKDISIDDKSMSKLLTLMRKSQTKRNLEKAIKDVDRIVLKGEKRIEKEQKATDEKFENIKETQKQKDEVRNIINNEIKNYIDDVLNNESLILRKSEVKSLSSLMEKSHTEKNYESSLKQIDRIVENGRKRARLQDQKLKETREKLNTKLKEKRDEINNIKDKSKSVKNQFGKGKQANDRIKELNVKEFKRIINLLNNKKTTLQEFFNIIDEIVVTTDNRKLEKDISAILKKKRQGSSADRVKGVMDETHKTALDVFQDEITVKLEAKDFEVKDTEKGTKVVGHLEAKQSAVRRKLDDLIKRQGELYKKIFEIEQERYIERDGEVEEVDLSADAENLLVLLKKEYRIKHLAKEYLEAQISDVHTKNDKLKFVYENIKSIDKTGRDILENLRTQEKQKFEQERKDILDDIDPNKKLLSKDANVSLKDLQQKNKRLMVAEMLDNYLKYGVFNLRTLFVILSRKGYESWDDSPLIDLENRLTHQFNVKETNKRIMLTHLNDIMKSNFGSSYKADKVLNKKHNIEKNGVEVPLTTSQLLNVWMNWHNVDLRGGLKENGFTEDVMQQIENILPDNVKNFGNDLFAFYDKYYELNNEVFKKMQYISLPKEKFFAGKVYRTQETIRQETPNLMDMIRFGTTAHGSLKSRTKNNKPIDAVDVVFLAKKYIDETAHYNAFAEIHREYSRLFRDADVKKAIELNNPGKSKTFLDIIDWYKKMYMENGGDRGMRIVQAVAKNVIQAQLQLKTKIGLTQTMSFTNGFAEMPKGTTLQEYFKYYASIGKNLKWILKDDYIKNRYGLEGFTEAMTGLNQVVNSSKYTNSQSLDAHIRQFNKVYERLKNAGMSPVKIGDLFGIIGTLPVYEAYYQKFRKQYSEEVARDKALKRWRSVADRTQQAISPFRKSYLQHHQFARYFMMYQTAPIQNFNNAYMHALELKRGLKKQGHKGGNWQNAYAVLNYQIMQPLLYTWFAQALAGSFNVASDKAKNDNDKNLVSSVIVGNAKSLPIVGQILQNTVDIALEKEKIYGLGIPSPVQDSYSKFMKYLKLSATAQTEAKRKKYMMKAFVKGAGLIGGVSEFGLEAMINDMNKIYTNDEITNQVKWLRGLGYSEKVIEDKLTPSLNKSKAEIEKAKRKIRAIKREIKQKDNIPEVLKKQNNG